ncbi:TPA: hypothetical protein PKO72_002516 [Aeromonas hydrophila]|uniref:hypothetical protein n=1 Tax=Aeromonas hydrophila TaxID=644 RepID=UPI001CCBF988|nr:hypothetical protein [Aeromonas hydrophila]MCW4615349.1 hypothetical protein [Aeromonas hydrophila]UBQ50898.1 hypothetical protein LCH17_01850 [Aeromonas hydrophila]HDI1213775.1 hypothetical protein [Aeromonas hydrophila]
MKEKTIYNPYLSESMFFKPEQMYGENREVFKEIPYIEKGNIYFITERVKVRVISKSVKLSKGAILRFAVQADGHKEKFVEIETAPLFIDLGGMFRKIFGDSKSLQKNMIGVQSHEEYMKILRSSVDSLPIIGVSYLENLQNKKNIPLRIHTPDGRYGDLPFTIHSILSEYDIKIGDFPKILYIGRSGQLNERIYRHERIQEALAVIDDESDIFLYSFQFKDSRLRISEVSTGNTVIHRKEEVDDITENDRVALVEMALINYFKPIMNTDYVHSDLNNSEIFQRALKGRYNQLVQEIDHDGGFWNFGSDIIFPALRHEIHYSVNC